MLATSLIILGGIACTVGSVCFASARRHKAVDDYEIAVWCFLVSTASFGGLAATMVAQMP